MMKKPTTWCTIDWLDWLMLAVFAVGIYGGIYACTLRHP